MLDKKFMIKCIDNQDGLSGLTIGKIYKPIREDKKQYRVVNDNNKEVWCNTNRFEIIKEENKVKEYSFEEVIANIKEGEGYKCTSDIYIIKTIHKNEIGLEFNGLEPLERCGTNDIQRFVKVENQASFNDILKSDARCRIEYYRIKDMIKEESPTYDWLEGYQNLDDIIATLSQEFNTIAFKEIMRNAKWYLEDNN